MLSLNSFDRIFTYALTNPGIETLNSSMSNLKQNKSYIF